MASTLLRFVNSRGIPTIESTGETLTTEGETFTFNSHPFVHSNFQGLIIVKISGTATAPSTAVPIYFTTNGVPNSTVGVYSAAGTAITTSTWSGDGVYLFFYDRDTNILRQLTGVI